MKHSFIIGLLITLVVGSGYAYHQATKFKTVTNAEGLKSSCQVVRYRFWYEIKNCTQSDMNQKMVWMNDINKYKIE